MSRLGVASWDARRRFGTPGIPWPFRICSRLPDRRRRGRGFGTRGRLVFQKRDAAGQAVGEPWFWPETEDSSTTFEDPRLVEHEGGTWLVFVERGSDGSVRSRAISLSEIFADGFESATTAAWSSTEPAVNLFIDSPAQDAATREAAPTIVVRFATPTGIAIDPETLSFRRDRQPLAMTCTPADGGADCVPATPFGDGPVTIEATIADVAGHLLAAGLAAVHGRHRGSDLDADLAGAKTSSALPPASWWPASSPKT